MASAIRLVALLAAVVVAAPVSTTQPAAIPRKSLAGPPEEFAHMSLPDPVNGAINTDSAAYFITLTTASNGQSSWSRVLDVDSKEGFSLNIFSPIEEHLTFSLKDPQGNEVDLSKAGTPVRAAPAFIALAIFSRSLARVIAHLLARSHRRPQTSLRT